MSLSNPTLKNPASLIFQWAGSKGDLMIYDREKKKNIKIKLPFTFIVLDQLATIGGYSKRLESGIWANEVRNTIDDIFYVKTRKGPVEAGRYRDLTETMKLGGKYAAAVYIAYQAGSEWRTGKFMAMGSALSAWIEFRKANDAGSAKVIMERGEQLTAQTGPYWPPKFSLEKWDQSEFDAAIELDKNLQIYLSKVLNMARDEQGNELPEEDTYATPEQQSDFERRKQEAGFQEHIHEVGSGGLTTPGHDKAQAVADSLRKDKEEPDTVIDDFDENEPIDLSDIPF